MKIFPSDLSSANHYIRLQSESRKLVIIFSAKELPSHKYNFWIRGQELNANVIYVNNGTDAWYQDGVPNFGDSHEGTIQLLKSWIDTLNVKQAFCIGTSMGGYAAILYGALLNARILAFSCETELQQPYSRSINYMPKSVQLTMPDLTPFLKEAKYPPTFIVGESDPRDVQTAAMLKASTPRARVVSLCGSNHYVPTYLNRSGRLLEVLTQFISEKESTFYDEGLALQIDGFSDMLYNSYTASIDKEWEKAKNCAQSALELYPYADAALYILGKSMLKTENYKDAVAPLSLACQIAPYNAEYHFQFSHALRMSGSVHLAKVILHRSMVRFPNNARIQFALAMIAYKNGNYDLAYKHTLTACSLSPQNKTFHDRLQIINRKLAR